MKVNPLFVLGGGIFLVGILAQAFGERVEKFMVFGGLVIAALGLFVKLAPVRLGKA